MKIILDLDDPDILPLVAWLRILRLIRIAHESRRNGNKAAAARRLGISRYSVYRGLKLS